MQKYHEAIQTLSIRMCNYCLEIGRPNTIDAELIGEYDALNDLVEALSNDLTILQLLVKQYAITK